MGDDGGYGKYRRFFRQDPLLIVEWHDRETEAVGWLVVNSLRGGACGGGTRMRQDATRDEATFLAKTMEIKLGVSGPPIGGAKSVLRFDPNDRQRKEGVLCRWFEAIAPYLRECYGTGGDLGVNEVREVTPLTRRAVGLAHPQEGIARGHYKLEGAALRRVIEQLTAGVELEVRPPGLDGHALTIAGLITGYGVAVACRAYYEKIGASLAGKRVLVEGFGDVGGPSALYLQRAGAKVVGIISRGHGRRFSWRLDADGLDVADLLRQREGADLPPGGTESDTAEPFWDTPADLFIPAAASHLVDVDRLERLRNAGVTLIACGANTPFADRELGEVRVQQLADSRFAVIPDFIANCGMARAFHYLMQEGARLEEAPIEAAVTQTIEGAMARLLAGYTGGGGLLDRAFALYVPETPPPTEERLGGIDPHLPPGRRQAA